MTRAFQIEIIDSGEWIRVEDMLSGYSGYIHSDPKASRFLHRKLPELDFANGVLGYLRMRQSSGPGGFDTPPELTASLAKGSLERFVEVAPAEDKEARALASALMGALQVQAAGDWTKAREHLAAAIELPLIGANIAI